MSNLSELLRDALAGGSLLALPLALAGGVLTGLNPCCLALYPAAAATCCATRQRSFFQAASTALAFVAGLSLATTSLGVAAALAGKTMATLGGWARYAIALVPLVMAVYLLGWVRLPLPASAGHESRRGVGGAFVSGLLLSMILVPCGTPLLAAVLSYAAYEGSVPYGSVLLFLYGFGAGVPLLLVGTTVGGLGARLDALGWRKRLDRLTAVLLLVFGFYLLWNA
jgi:cytochrome c biogenesis protein CcdA